MRGEGGGGVLHPRMERRGRRADATRAKVLMARGGGKGGLRVFSKLAFCGREEEEEGLSGHYWMDMHATKVAAGKGRGAQKKP